jgi:hypothetical protein
MQSNQVDFIGSSRPMADNSLSGYADVAHIIGVTEGKMATVRLMLWGVLMAALPVETGTAQPRIAPEEMPADSLAIQLHRQGYRCDAPVAAERDAGLSKPDEPVWVLKCANGSYRMRLVPHMAAVVEPLD